MAEETRVPGINHRPLANDTGPSLESPLKEENLNYTQNFLLPKLAVDWNKNLFKILRRFYQKRSLYQGFSILDL